MKKIEKNSAGANYSAVNIGQLSQLNEHTHILSPEIQIGGKVFVGDSLATTGAEISFQTFEPNEGSGFLHCHKAHEELYIFTKGSGEFQVDGTIFPITEGSIIKVAPSGKRAVRNTGSESLVMICVQYRAESFDRTDKSDGIINDAPVIW